MIFSFGLDQPETDYIDEVFPGGVLPDKDMVLDGIGASAGQLLGKILEMRREVAISGAMRWPWSTEAHMQQSIRVRIR